MEDRNDCAQLTASRCAHHAYLFGLSFYCFILGESVPKPNYHQARKQRELAKKARQQAKLERRSAHPVAPEAAAAETPAQTPAAGDPAGSGGGE